MSEKLPVIACLTCLVVDNCPRENKGKAKNCLGYVTSFKHNFEANVICPACKADKKYYHLKDTEKLYMTTDKCVKAFNKNGKQILYDELESISHFGIVRDYTIKLKGGGEVWLDYGIVKLIVEEENKK